MPIKYTRETEVRNEREIRKTPWLRQGPLARPISRKQWFFILFVGMTTIVLLTQIALNLNRTAPYAFQSVIRGFGTIVEKGVYTDGIGGESGSGGITLEVAVGGGLTMRADWRIPEPYWSELSVGDTLALFYQVNQYGTEIRIRECGVVALKDEIR